MSMMLHAVGIGLGSNQGDRVALVHNAYQQICALPHTQQHRIAPLYETAPVGLVVQDHFINTVMCFQTDLSAENIFMQLMQIEKKLGRVREGAVAGGPRTIDIDFLFYGDEVLALPQLLLPHPRMHERRFVLEPLCQLSPQWQHPLLKKTAQQLLPSTISQKIKLVSL